MRPLPELPDALEDSLGDVSEISPDSVGAAAYGKTRWQQGCRAAEVGREFSALCRPVLARGLDVFVQALPRANQTRLVGIRDHVLRFFEEAIAESIEPFGQSSQTICRADDHEATDKKPDACKQSDDREGTHADGRRACAPAWRFLAA